MPNIVRYLQVTEKHLLPQIPLQLHRKPLPVPIILVGADNSLAIPHKLSPHMQRVAVKAVARGVAQWPLRKLHVLGDAVYLHGGQEGNLYVLHMPRRPTPCWIAPHFGRLAARERFDSSRRNAHRNGHHLKVAVHGGGAFACDAAVVHRASVCFLG